MPKTVPSLLLRALSLLLVLFAAPPLSAQPAVLELRAADERSELRLLGREAVPEKFGEPAAEGRVFLVLYGVVRRTAGAPVLFLERGEDAFRLALADGGELAPHPLTADSFDGWWGAVDMLPGEERPFELVFEAPKAAEPRRLLFDDGEGRLVLEFGAEETSEPVATPGEASGSPVDEEGETVPEAATAAGSSTPSPVPAAELELAGEIPEVPPPPAVARNIVTVERALAGITAGDGHEALRDGRTGPDAPVTRVGLGDPLLLRFVRPLGIERLRFLLRAPEGGGYRYRLETSADGEVWELLAERTDGFYGGLQEFSFPPRPLRAIRLTATAASEGIELLEVEEFEAWSRDHVPVLRRNLAWGGHGGRVLSALPALADPARELFPLVNGGDDLWEAPAEGPVELVLGFVENAAFLIDAVGLQLPDPARAPRTVDIAVSVEGPDRGFLELGSFPVTVEDGRAVLPFSPRAARFLRLRLRPDAGRRLLLGDIAVFEAEVEGYDSPFPDFVALESEAPPASRNIALAANGGRLLAHPEIFDGSPEQLNNGATNWESPAVDGPEAAFLFRFLDGRRARIEEVRLHLDGIDWPGRIAVEVAEEENGPYEPVARVLLPPSYEAWRAVRFVPVEARYLRILFTPAAEDGGREVIDEIAVLEDEGPDYLSILEVPFAEQLPLGPNLALALLGGEILRASAVEEQQGWSPRRLIDGLVGDAYGGARGSVGWTTPPQPAMPVELDLRLAGDRPARIVGVGLNPSFKTKAAGILDTDFLGAAANRPREVEILTSLDGENWEPAGRFEMRNRAVLQTFAFPAAREARFLRFRLLSNYGGDRLQLGELEVYEDPTLDGPESVLADRPPNIARPELGGAVVAFTGHYGESWIGRLFDGDPASFWSPDEGWVFPQRVRLAFAGDAPAEIAALEIVPRDGGEEGARPKTVRLRRMLEDDPSGSFELVGEFEAPEGAGVWRIPFDPPLEARYLELSILANFGSRYLNIGELRVLEAVRDGYRSVLARAREEELARGRRAVEAAGMLAADREEREPNDVPAQAGPLALGESVAGRIDPVGERDHFRLTVTPETPRPLLLELLGEPRLKTRLEIEDKGGATVFALDPDRSRRAFAGSIDLGPGDHLLRLFEPRTRIVLLVDVSGSMEERIGDARRAVLRYAADVQPQEEVAIVKFSSAPELVRDFTSDGETLVAAARDAIQIGGATALYDALAMALDRLEDYPGNRAIVLLSDGADSRSSLKYPDIRRRLTESGVRFYAIALGEGMWTYNDAIGSTPGRMLAHLARGTGGRRYLTPSSSELLHLYGEIARELRTGTRYRLRISPPAGEGQLVLRQVGERIAGVGTPDKLLFVFDASGSMRGRDAAGERKIRVARQVLKKLVGGLPDEVRIGLRVYGHRYPREPKDRSCTDTQLVVPFQRVDKAAFARFVDSIQPKGQTPIGLSLRQVAEDFGEVSGPKIVVLITDGEETCSPDPGDPDYPPRVVEDLRARGLDVKVNIVGFDIDKDEVRAFLADLAASTGGVFYSAADAGELEAAIEAALRTPYEVRDLRGEVIARGTLDGGPVRLPAGIYRVEVAAVEPLVIEDVVIEAGRATLVEIDKEGREIAVERGIGEMLPEVSVAVRSPETAGRVPTAASPAESREPAPTRAEPDRATRIAALLDEAESLFSANKLTTPKGASAIDRYRAVLALDPANTKARAGIERIVQKYVGWAEKARERGDAEKALSYLRRAVTADPDSIPLRMLLGIDLMAAGRAEEAIREFRAAKERDPSFTAADFYLGVAYMQIEDYAKALTSLERAVDDEEYGPRARLQRAFVRLLRNEHEQAYEEGVAGLRAKGDCESGPLDQTCTDLWSAVGYALLGMERYDVVADTLRQVLDFEPIGPTLFELVAMALREQGREEEAREVEERAGARAGE